MTQGLALEDPAYFDRLSQVDRSHWWPAAMWRIASAWLDDAMIGQEDRIALDVGCGSGSMLERISSRAEIAAVIGLEPSHTAIMQAKAQTHPVIQASALRLPFPASHFDLVTCLDVFQHLNLGDDRTAARELYRVIRPGGLVLIRANGRGLWPDPTISARLYRLSDLIELTRDAGLQILRASYVNCLPAIASEILGRVKRTRGAGHPAGQGLRIDVTSPWKNHLMGLISGVETVVAGRLRQSLPIGHSTMVLARRPISGSVHENRH